MDEIILAFGGTNREGGILQDHHGQATREEQITELGMIMATIPMDPLDPVPEHQPLQLVKLLDKPCMAEPSRVKTLNSC
jgi:hypothetical protein